MMASMAEGSSECRAAKVRGSVCVIVPSMKPAPPNRALLMAQVFATDWLRYGSRLEAGTRKVSVSPVRWVSHDQICADGNPGILGAGTPRNGDCQGPTGIPATRRPLAG